VFLISLEDFKSSRLYFESFQRELVDRCLLIISEHRGTDPKSVIASAKSTKEKREREGYSFDQVWIVFDTEGHQHPRRKDINNAIEQCRALSFKMAMSNPSFEYWLLLHFVPYGQPINDSAAAESLLKKHIKDYHKGMNAYDATRDKLDIAINNAKEGFKSRGGELENTHPCTMNPCTQIYRLIENLQAD